MARDPILIIITGRKRIGKTQENVLQFETYAFKSTNKKRILFCDINNEFGDYVVNKDAPGEREVKVPLIGNSKDDIIKFGNGKGGAWARIVPRNKNGSPMNDDEIVEMTLRAVTFMRNGILYLEDFSAVFSDALPTKVAQLLCNNSHRNCDIAISAHSIDRILPKLWTNVNLVRFHKQNDEVIDSRDKIGKVRLELFLIAEKMVNKEYNAGNIRFFVYVNIDDSKISGQFSPKMLSEAIIAYLSENPRSIDAMMRQRDGQGGKVHTWESALRDRTKELFVKYWGN